MTGLVGPICLRVCTKCLEVKALEDYDRQASGKYGRKGACRTCVAVYAMQVRRLRTLDREKERLASIAWRAANPAKARQGRLDAYQKNAGSERERMRKWRVANPEKYKECIQKWVALNAPRVRENKNQWRLKNMQKINAEAAAKRLENPAKNKDLCDRRKARMNLATPVWACKAGILKVYQSARDQGAAVDHIYPLNGKTVSGLHVPENLRVLSKLTNSRKRNKLPGILGVELWDPKGRDVFMEEQDAQLQ